MIRAKHLGNELVSKRKAFARYGAIVCGATRRAHPSLPRGPPHLGSL